MHILTGSSTPKSIYHTIPWLIVLGTAIDLFGIYIRTSSFKTLGRHFTFQVTLHEDHSLVTDFPYTIVRHPGYMGALMNYIGLAITLAPADGWARAYLWSYLSEQGGVPNIIAKTFIFISVYCYVLVAAMFFERTYAEDRLLHARFGKRWEDWVARVPYKIIPGLF
jgi:protein-S-isoprenylcysteine O-methyltransferase Ste14